MPQEFMPLLKPENIDELKSLILQIMEDNDSKLEKIIQTKQNEAIQHSQDFTIQDLNDLLTQQCLQKQTIVSNLSHFALSLMNTIDVLWQDNEDLEYRVKDQRDVIGQMDSHLRQMGKQSEFLKNKLHLAYDDMQKIEEEKQQVEEYLSSIIVKHDSSFCLKKSRKVSLRNEEQKICEEDMILQEPDMYFTEHEMAHDQYQSERQAQQAQISRQYGQNAEVMFNKQNLDLANRKTTEIDLLQESVIKQSISVLRRFTLSDQFQQCLPILEQSQDDDRFVSKSHRFSLINQVSLQIFDQSKDNDTQKDQPTTSYSFAQTPSYEKYPNRDLKISNHKINITIATGTQHTQTRDSEKHHEQMSMLQTTPSYTSFMLPRQNSAVMNPSLERSCSSVSFVTQTTKIIQTDPPKAQKQKEVRRVEKKSIGIDTSTAIDKPQIGKKHQVKGPSFTKERSELNKSVPQKGQEESRKSFGQLLDYFTKKIVSDRIKTGGKKNEIGAFKKTKSNIQKVF